MASHHTVVGRDAPRYTKLNNSPVVDSVPQHKGAKPTARFSTDNDTEFNYLKQSLRIFWPQISRWILTVVLVSTFLGTLKIYERKGNFTSTEKDYFNVITTALNLGLGLNFFVSRKASAARNLRGLMTICRHRKRSKTWPNSYDGGSWPGKITAFEKWI